MVYIATLKSIQGSNKAQSLAASGMAEMRCRRHCDIRNKGRVKRSMCFQQEVLASRWWAMRPVQQAAISDLQTLPCVRSILRAQNTSASSCSHSAVTLTPSGSAVSWFPRWERGTVLCTFTQLASTSSEVMHAQALSGISLKKTSPPEFSLVSQKSYLCNHIGKGGEWLVHLQSPSRVHSLANNLQAAGPWPPSLGSTPWTWNMNTVCTVLCIKERFFILPEDTK